MVLESFTLLLIYITICYDCFFYEYKTNTFKDFKTVVYSLTVTNTFKYVTRNSFTQQTKIIFMNRILFTKHREQNNHLYHFHPPPPFISAHDFDIKALVNQATLFENVHKIELGPKGEK